jgi:hypothetical protein
MRLIKRLFHWLEKVLKSDHASSHMSVFRFVILECFTTRKIEYI